MLCEEGSGDRRQCSIQQQGPQPRIRYRLAVQHAQMQAKAQRCGAAAATGRFTSPTLPEGLAVVVGCQLGGKLLLLGQRVAAQLRRGLRILILEHLRACKVCAGM